MKKVYIIGVPDAQSAVILEKVKKAYPDHEVIMVDSIEDVPAEDRPEFQKLPMPITKMDDLHMPKMAVKDLKFNNPFPAPHHTSRNYKKY